MKRLILIFLVLFVFIPLSAQEIGLVLSGGGGKGAYEVGKVANVEFDKENIWDVAKWSGSEISEQYLPFAMDNFGNLICFQKDNATIVFINMENKSIEDVANSFAEFMKKLEELINIKI